VVPGACQERVKLGELQLRAGRPSARVTAPPGGCRHVDVNGSHAVVDLPRVLYDFGYAWEAHVHNDCVCNELVALHNRHLVNDPDVSVSDEGRAWLTASATQMLERMRRVEPWRYSKVIARMPPNKRAAYQRAAESLKEFPINERDAKIDCMLKKDKVDLRKIIEGKVARCIQYRGKRYTLELMACGLKAIEEEFYKRMKFGVSHTRNVAKGLNQSQRGALLRSKWDAFSEPVAILLDATAWDAHVSPELLQAEHDFYTRALPSRRLQRLLVWQRKNRGRTRGGIKYTVQGTRMSGDANTALGNCALNLMMLLAVLRNFAVQGDILLDGDDSVLIVESRDLSKLEHLDIYMANHFGMNMKMEFAREFEKIDFCQSRPIEVESGSWRMVRYPDRAMSKDVVTVRNVVDKWAELASAIGNCEMSLNCGVPVLQSFAGLMKRAGGGKGTGIECAHFEDIVYRARQQARDTGWDSRPVLNCARVSFWRAFDISVSEQLEIEALLDAHEPRLHPPRLRLHVMGAGVPV